MQWLSIQRQTGTPQVAGFHTIIGESLVVQVRWPGGGFVWNTPVAIHAQRRGHTITRRVLDGTRLAQFGLAVMTIVVMIWLSRERKQV